MKGGLPAVSLLPANPWSPLGSQAASESFSVRKSESCRPERGHTLTHTHTHTHPPYFCLSFFPLACICQEQHLLFLTQAPPCKTAQEIYPLTCFSAVPWGDYCPSSYGLSKNKRKCQKRFILFPLKQFTLKVELYRNKDSFGATPPF